MKKAALLGSPNKRFAIALLVQIIKIAMNKFVMILLQAHRKAQTNKHSEFILFCFIGLLML